jgi:hypothetical protein
MFGVIPAKAGIQTAFSGDAVVTAKLSWIPARAPLGRNDGKRSVHGPNLLLHVVH